MARLRAGLFVCVAGPQCRRVGDRAAARFGGPVREGNVLAGQVLCFAQDDRERSVLRMAWAAGYSGWGGDGSFQDDVAWGIGGGGGGVGETASETGGVSERLTVVQDGAEFVDSVDEQAGGVFHAEGVEPGLHGPADRVEHISAAGSPYRYDGGEAVDAGSADNGAVKAVVADPEALAAVYKELRLGGDGHEEDGGGEDDAVGVEDFADDRLEIVDDVAASSGKAVVALGAGGDLEVGQVYFFGPGTEGFSAEQGPLEERIAIAAFSWAGGDAKNLQSWSHR